MSQFPWLQEYLTQWLDLLMAKKVPHAILLSGAKGLAKKDLAQSMAHFAICENITEEGVCNSCKGCHLFNSGNHTDIVTIRAEKEIIKVEQIRNLSKNVVLSSTRNQHRIMIIEDAEKMNKASANALLKTLEEPPKNVVIILTTSEIGYLLPTIKSRCFKINLKTVQEQQLTEYLSSVQTSSHDDINQAIILANYAPLIAIRILENNVLATVKSMLNDLNQIIKNEASILDVSKQWMKNEQTDNLLFIAAYFLNVVKFQNGLEQLGAISKLSNVNYSAVNDHNKKTLTFIKNIYAFLTREKTSLKVELLLEELLIGWKNDFQN